MPRNPDQFSVVSHGGGSFRPRFTARRSMDVRTVAEVYLAVRRSENCPCRIV